MLLNVCFVHVTCTKSKFLRRPSLLIMVSPAHLLGLTKEQDAEWDWSEERGANRGGAGCRVGGQLQWENTA